MKNIYSPETAAAIHGLAYRLTIHAEPRARDYYSAAAQLGLSLGEADLAVPAIMLNPPAPAETPASIALRQELAAARAAQEAATAKKHRAYLRANFQFPGRENKAARDAFAAQILAA
jgi:hypothetical protein